ncbi:hypothetical protein PVK06_003987 [Gossypium arboreum]|uniref:Uncharacterized protein n=1 Tax=Gossypium arboreum TaxID=29729 RepID=A0ABR0QQR8_GOSAR|nr:hypothetical protein PVK06_003987 [Gossypium arboreum]
MNPNRLVYSCRSFDWAPPEYFSPPPLFKSSFICAPSTLASNGEEERPIFFDSKAKSKCSASAETVHGRHPERWHKDAADNIVCKCFCNCQGCICFEYNHIVPFPKADFEMGLECATLI